MSALPFNISSMVQKRERDENHNQQESPVSTSYDDSHLNSKPNRLGNTNSNVTSHTLAHLHSTELESHTTRQNIPQHQPTHMQNIFNPQESHINIHPNQFIPNQHNFQTSTMAGNGPVNTNSTTSSNVNTNLNSNNTQNGSVTVPLTLPNGQIIQVPLSQIQSIAAQQNVKSSIDRPITDREPGSTIETSIGECIVINKLVLAYVNRYGGKNKVNIRRFYLDKSDNSVKPGKAGVALDGDQWRIFKSLIPILDEKLKN